jgi:hypothetical protein
MCSYYRLNLLIVIGPEQLESTYENFDRNLSHTPRATSQVK